MKTDWDYTALADAYLKRPDYSDAAIDAMLERAGIGPGGRACDIGAGAAHLTVKLAERGLIVSAVEPNDAMRRHGTLRSTRFREVRWREGTGEATGEPADSFDLVTFGSSFNVTDRPAALRESARILKARGWFACMWNHRDLSDPLQAGIEAIIARQVPGYSYGARREDQVAVIEACGLFEPVHRLEGRVLHSQTRTDCVEAWRSHATLHRQAGAERFEAIIGEIRRLLDAAPSDAIVVPYTTRIWIARRK